MSRTFGLLLLVASFTFCLAYPYIIPDYYRYHPEYLWSRDLTYRAPIGVFRSPDGRIFFQQLWSLLGLGGSRTEQPATSQPGQLVGVVTGQT